MLDFRSAGPDDTVEEFRWDVDLLMNEPRMGDLVVVVLAEVSDDLLGGLHVGGDVPGDSNSARRFHVSDLVFFGIVSFTSSAVWIALMVLPPDPTISERNLGWTDTEDSPKPSACSKAAYPRLASSRMAFLAVAWSSAVPSEMTTVALALAPPTTGRNWLPPVSGLSGALTSSLVPVFSWMEFMVAPLGPMMIPTREASMVTVVVRAGAATASSGVGAACFLGLFFRVFLGMVSHSSSTTMRGWSGTTAGAAGVGVGAGAGAGAGALLAPLAAFFFLFFFFFPAAGAGAGAGSETGVGSGAGFGAGAGAGAGAGFGAGAGAGGGASAFFGAAAFFLFFLRFFFLGAADLAPLLVLAAAGGSTVALALSLLLNPPSKK
ncbi:unnamed protein product [Pseudo-nitzschia multistriata]|uniref:Uncharacterized protein n=1 Tax=Pseudo-nitzschia multistriata TaxID=183589 RepID=A0A448ZFQ8_9STRA|nr:unnamed protein product [Pseudo-nitzschia multistriata]